MTAPLEDRQLLRGKRGTEPGQVLVRQEKIVFIDDDADVGVGAQTGFIHPQIIGFLHAFPRHAAGLIVRNGKFIKIILIGILKDFLIRRLALEIM